MDFKVQSQDEKCFNGQHIWEYIKKRLGGFYRTCKHCGVTEGGY
jgi:hypothetical protein